MSRPTPTAAETVEGEGTKRGCQPPTLITTMSFTKVLHTPPATGALLLPFSNSNFERVTCPQTGSIHGCMLDKCLQIKTKASTQQLYQTFCNTCMLIRLYPGAKATNMFKKVVPFHKSRKHPITQVQVFFFHQHSHHHSSRN